MEFGKVDDLTILDRLDFALPKDDELTRRFLPAIKQLTESLRIGAPAWGRREWLGRLYPTGTKAADFLFHYAQHFETIELNTTHYRIPSVEQAKKWADQVPLGFEFCPKVYKEISHSKLGMLNKLLIQEWLEFLNTLEGKLGPCFIQFPPTFTYSEKSILFQFLKLWPDDFPLSLEFRHTSWFQDHKILPALVEYLQTRRIGLVITDVAGRRDVLHTSVSSDHCMIRLIGNDLHSSDFTRAEAWLDKLKSWQELGLRKPILFLHQPDDIKLPEMADAVREMLAGSSPRRQSLFD